MTAWPGSRRKHRHEHPSVADIVQLGRACYLTGTVLDEWARAATPKQREFLHGMLRAEHDSRQQSRRAPAQGRAPARPENPRQLRLGGTVPDDYDQTRLACLEFIDYAQDLVLFGDVGTGKTHLACALVAAC